MELNSFFSVVLYLEMRKKFFRARPCAAIEETADQDSSRLLPETTQITKLQSSLIPVHHHHDS